MKKYLIIGIIILAIVIIYNLLSLYTGLYIDFNPDDTIHTIAHENEGKIYLQDEQTPFEIKGVEVNGSYPGHNFSEYSIEKETYKQWLQQIQEMGANTIKLSNRLDPEFYEALYEHNTETDNPLYLMQGIEIEEYETNNAQGIYGFKDELLKECLLDIDAIHGNRYVLTSGIAGQGGYTDDVSQWTLGYIISSIGTDETIAYTDNTDTRNEGKGYDGTYFYTDGQEASETEDIIAEILDKMVEYESKKYNEQKFVSVMIDRLKDPFDYKQNVDIQLGKIAYINMNHIKTKEELKTGKIVSYNMVGTIDDFIDILDETEIQRNQEILNTVQADSIYNGYVDFINKYYDAPVLIASYGYSTSRMIDEENEEPITEEEQGEKLVADYNEFVSLGTCGAIISTWQDNWSLTNWNVKYATTEEKEIYWHNVQAIDQCYGILSFESKDKEQICYVDGNIEEWTEDSLIKETNGIKLYLRYDYENVYIMAENIDTSKELYIPIDTTQKSGAISYYDAQFDKNIDFLIKVDGTENGEILVQEYYDSIRAMYEDNITGLRQYSNVPNKDTTNFSNIRAILRKKVDPTIDISLMTALQRQQYRMYRVYNTGKLVYGNHNPNSDEYNSLADYCFGENCVEIQIPWEILNFSSPSEMLIHDDYYENYGVEDQKIEELYIGIGYETEKIELGKSQLKGWEREVEVEETLKKSYDIIKQAWGEE